MIIIEYLHFRGGCAGKLISTIFLLCSFSVNDIFLPSFHRPRMLPYEQVSSLVAFVTTSWWLCIPVNEPLEQLGKSPSSSMETMISSIEVYDKQYSHHCSIINISRLTYCAWV